MGRINILFWIFFMSILTFWSCNNDSVPLDVNCIECIPVNSDSSNMSQATIESTINNDNDTVPITVYKGKFSTDSTQNTKLLDTFAVEKKLILNLKVDQYYTIKAVYNYDGKKINVIDGNNLRRHKIKDVCDSECYVYTGDYINVSFKFK